MTDKISAVEYRKMMGKATIEERKHAKRMFQEFMSCAPNREEKQTHGEYICATLPIKLLSVNECWQGRRFKTDAYTAYEKEVLLKLPAAKPPQPPYRLIYEFGMSNIMSDFDNPVKPLTDILQKKYGFNDRQIMEAHIKKVKVDKGNEYFSFALETITEV